MSTVPDADPRAALSVDELVAAATDLAAQPDRWRPHVEHDPAQRVFHRLVAEPRLSVWLICWMPGHDTGFHDHDGAAGVVHVLEGEVREQRLRFAGEPTHRVCGPGETLRVLPADIHRVSHHGTAPATTIHAYSPELLRMGAYVSGADGVLLRHVIDEEEELRAEP